MSEKLQFPSVGEYGFKQELSSLREPRKDVKPKASRYVEISRLYIESNSKEANIVISNFVQKFLMCDQVRIACLGDSITAGYFESREKMHGIRSEVDAYPYKLKQMLNNVRKDCNVEIVNAGIGGNTAKDGLERLEKDVLCYQPDLVIVSFGANDVYHEKRCYLMSLKGIFTELNRRNIPAIFLAPAMFNTKVVSDILTDIAEKTAEMENAGVLADYFSSAVQLAIEYRIAVCDCYTRWKHLNALGVDTNQLLANGINHPSRPVQTMIAFRLFDTIFY